MSSFEQLKGRLEATKSIAAAATARGVNKAGLLVEGDAKRLCPVDSGRLRGSISTEMELTESGGTAHVGTNVEYAPYVEYGTGQRGDPVVAHKTEWLGMPPKPFFRPALELNRENCKRIIEYEVRKALK